ncbi:hypothetical protein J1614_009043 [Plenodomus biglobosus]|nr:hypothetical protein J1614_009043 [Plenodomus biglobosus]
MMADFPTEDALMYSHRLGPNQNRHQSVQTEDVTTRHTHTGGEEPYYSSSLVPRSPVDVHEDFPTCDTRDDASISFESDHFLECLSTDREVQYVYRDDVDDEQLVPPNQGIDVEAANWHSYSQPLVPMDISARTVEYDSQSQTPIQSSLALPQAVSATGDLLRESRGMFARGSIEDSQMFANDTSSYFPESSSGSIAYDSLSLQQPWSSPHRCQASRRQGRDNRRSISSYKFSNDTNTDLNTDQLLPSVINRTHTEVPSISLSEEPWSSETRRQSNHQSSLRREIDMLVHQTTRSVSAITDISSGADLSFMPDNNAQNSASSWNSTYGNTTESWDTLRPIESQFNGWGWPTDNADDHVPALTDIRPYLNGGDATHPTEVVNPQLQTSRLARHVSHSNTNYLSVPGQDDEGSEHTSERSSTSAPVPDTVYCGLCNIPFQGAYRKGSYARHMRLKHNNNTPTAYFCEYCSSPKPFKRQDARLKHYRKHHPDLGVKPARPRRPSGISQTSSSSYANSMMQ